MWICLVEAEGTVLVLRKATCRGRVRVRVRMRSSLGVVQLAATYACGFVWVLQSGKQTRTENVCKRVRVVLADTSALESVEDDKRRRCSGGQGCAIHFQPGSDSSDRQAPATAEC
jgi:hypothetical protein